MAAWRHRAAGGGEFLKAERCVGKQGRKVVSILQIMGTFRPWAQPSVLPWRLQRARPGPSGEGKEAARATAARMPSPALSPRTTVAAVVGHSAQGSQEAGAVSVSLGVRGNWNLAARETETSCGCLRAEIGSRNPDRAGSPDMPKM